MQSKSMRDEDIIQDLKYFIASTVRNEISDQLAPVKEEVSNLREDVGGLKSDVAGLKSDVAELKDDVAILKDDVAELKDGLKRVDQKIDDLSSDVAEALNTSNDTHTAKLNNHEKRITKLELGTI